MALREDQVQRYGRQILLKELGGRGQRALLAAPVEVRGAGAALSEAVAYLAAGGSPLRLPPGFVPDGFLAGATPAALSPDVDAPGAAAVLLRSAEAEGAPGREVVVAGGVAWRSADACPACWSAVLAALPPAGPPTALGSLAALAVQRLVLGWAEPLGLVTWAGDRLASPPLPACPAHRISQ